MCQTVYNLFVLRQPKNTILDSRVSDHSLKVNSNLENKLEAELELAAVLRG